RHAFPHTLKHLPFAFSQLIEIVHEIDQQKFPAQFLGKGWPHAKVKRAASKRKAAVPLVIVDDSLVVELRRVVDESVVGGGGRKQKAAILQESFNQPIVFRRSFPEHGLLWVQVESGCRLR